jgi:hypothetical protein
MDQNVLNLVDTKVTDAANEALATAKTKLDTASANFAAARKTHNVAARAAELAIGSLADDAHERHEEHQAAASKLDVAKRVKEAAASAYEAAKRAVEASIGVAHRPVYSYGVELRIAAAKKADLARAMLKEAEADRAAATDVLGYAIGQGVGDVSFNGWRETHRPLDFNSEWNLWGNNYHVSWWPGLNADGSVRENL